MASVFVYGTLKEGFPNFRTNRGRRVPGDFVTLERFPLYVTGERHSPWLLHAPGQGEQVRGQVFQVDAPTLQAMDQLERVTAPDGHRRVAIQVQRVGEPAPLTVWAYLKRPDELTGTRVHAGPLGEYTLEQAAHYRPRGIPPTGKTHF